MMAWMKRRNLAVLCGGLLALGLLAGCSGSDDDDPAADGLTEGSAENPLAEFFPDGLHPNSKGSGIIAGVFARHIPSAAKAGAKNGEGGDGGGGDDGGGGGDDGGGGGDGGGGDGGGGGGGGGAPPAGKTGLVLCLGDSITRAGYPGSLAGRSGRTVINEGVGGETSGRGAQRISGLLSKHNPSYLCVLYGANDVIGAKAAPEAVAANLESIVRAAQANGTVVIVGTLTPMSGSRRQYAESARAVSAAIRAMASRTGARVADLEKAF